MSTKSEDDIDNAREVIRKAKALSDQIQLISAWNNQKYTLARELFELTNKSPWIVFEAPVSNNPATPRIGCYTETDIPKNKRGSLSPLRDKKAFIVCIGRARYSRVLLAATSTK